MAKTSARPMIRIHNTETDEIIDREMTDIEFEEHQALLQDVEAKQTERELQAAQREAILDRLGLTADEAKLLLG